MKTLQEIKNAYAIEQGYDDWEQLLRKNYWNDGDIEVHWTEICIRAQKVALENASKNGVAYKLAYPNNTSKAVVEKSSITNPENLIR